MDLKLNIPHKFLILTALIVPLLTCEYGPDMRFSL